MGKSKTIGNKTYSQDASGDWYEDESPVVQEPLRAKVVNGVQYHKDANGDWYQGEPIVKKKDGGQVSSTPSQNISQSSHTQLNSEVQSSSPVDVDPNQIPVTPTEKYDIPMDADVFKQAREYGKATEAINKVNEVAPDAEGLDKIKEKVGGLKKKIEDQGYSNADEVYQIAKDLPDTADPDELDQLSQLIKINPVAARTMANDIKSNELILGSAYKKSYDEDIYGGDQRDANAKANAIHTYNVFNNLSHADNLPDFINGIKQKQQIIDELTTGDERNKAHQRLEANALQNINANDPDLQKEYASSDLNKVVDANQYAGLKTLEIFHPDQYQQALKMLKINSKTETETQQKLVYDDSGKLQSADYVPVETEESIERKKGREAIGKKLADIGRNNSMLGLNREQHDLMDAYEKTDDPAQKDQIKQQFVDNQNKINQVQSDFSKDDTRYPLMAQLKYDDQVKELTQRAGMSPLGALFYHFGKGFKNTGETLGNIISSTFGSDEDNTLLQMQRLGESRTDQSTEYMPTSLEQTQKAIIPKFSKEIEQQRDAIINNNSLDEDQKKQAIDNLVMNNQDKIDYITNPESGKRANFLSMATVYGNAKTIGDIASIAAQTALLGEGGLSKMLSTTVPMFTTTQNDFYKQAVEEGNPNPSAYANIHATIMAAAGLINPDLNIVKRALGTGTAAGKLIAGLDEKTWNEVVASNKGVLSKFQNSALSVGKEAAKMGLTYGAGTSIANDLADQQLFNKDISGKDIIDHAIKSTKDILFNSAVLLGVNAISNYKTVSPDQKAGIWQLGVHPDIAIQEIKDAVAKEGLPQATADARIKVVKDISGLIERIPVENDKGKPLTDKQKIDYLYNALIKTKADRLKNDLSPEGIKKAEHQSLVADYRNELITNPLSNTALESAKNRLEKSLIPEKDAEGKDVPLNEKDKQKSEAQLEAINDEIEKRSIEQADKRAKDFIDTKLSVPIEGVDEQGIPNTGDVPPPTDVNNETQKENNTNAEGTTQSTGDNEQTSIPATEESPTGENPSEAAQSQPEEAKLTIEGEENPTQETTGIKKSITELDRTTRKLPEVSISKLGSDAESLAHGKESVDSGRLNPKEIVQRVNADKFGNGYTKDEIPAMLYYKHQLTVAENDLRSALNSHPEGSPEKLQAVNEYQQLQDEIDQKTEADRRNSAAWGQSGNLMQIETDQSFSPSNVRTIVKENYNGEIFCEGVEETCPPSFFFTIGSP